MDKISQNRRDSKQKVIFSGSKTKERGEDLSRLLPQDEIENLSSKVQKWVNKVGEKYFLRSTRKPVINKRKNKINISIELDKDEEGI